MTGRGKLLTTSSFFMWLNVRFSILTKKRLTNSPATPTSGANVVKVLMLIEFLKIPHHIEVVASTSLDSWFHEIAPTKMVPALEWVETHGGKRLNIFESSSCLEFLVERYDSGGIFGGKNIWEKTQVRNWLTMHTSGLG